MIELHALHIARQELCPRLWRCPRCPMALHCSPRGVGLVALATAGTLHPQPCAMHTHACANTCNADATHAVHTQNGLPTDVHPVCRHLLVLILSSQVSGHHTEPLNHGIIEWAGLKRTSKII